MAGEPERRVRKVRVTNGTDTPFMDRWNGVPITIQPGDAEDIPPYMAEHFFGFRPGVSLDAMLRHIARRQGWSEKQYTNQNPASQRELAAEYFSKFRIEPVFFRIVEDKAEAPDPKTPVPAEVEDVPEDDETPRTHRATPNWLKRQQLEHKARREQAATDQA